MGRFGAKTVIMILMAMVMMGLCACGAKEAKCEILSAEYVDSIPIGGGVNVEYKEYDIFKIVFSVTASEQFPTDDVKGDDFFYLY